MKDLNIKYWGMNLINLVNEVKKEHRLVVVLMLLWSVITNVFSSAEMSAGINQSVPLMVVLSLITFLLLLELSWWLLNRLWQRVGLPGIESMVLHYKEMELWQQIAFFWASFALCVLVGLGCLAAVV
ncbi:hypothetical protein HDC92_004995 [Pedobacter sp. AK017]|uniref:hypothetical protein n=1 Tax=Pedobacter sp. AK017 TaxID=2723073 RepID=UPI001618A8CA|nr:hypothetical protein [Pedobacter sp. AK017]MBB5441288.1 hypothetical protein [Pedobacter sp. AK017]